ncbi:hypothetical protein L218DRAFT_1007613 [Marasmius fiardii PR-910]|nr:hypothetical protein L218DRAFT_1007613 [Marasmius fiardii PR-910]
MFRGLLAFATLVLFASAAPTAEECRQIACADVIVIFVHSITEPAPIRTTVGPALQNALWGILGSCSLNFAGVEYPVDIAGFLEGGDPQGSRTMAQDIRAQYYSHFSHPFE